MEFKAKELLVAVAAKNEGDWGKTYEDIKNHVKPTDEKIKKFSSLAEQAVTVLDKDYPNAWKTTYRPSIVLFYKKRERSLLSKIETSSVSVLDDGGDLQTKKIIDDILEHGGLIATPDMDSGDIVIRDKTQSLTLSEYPCGAYDAHSEKQRARLVNISASLCGKLFVGIVEDISAVSTAVFYAVGGGAEVYAVPTSLGTIYANNKLIKEGAYIALDWEDVMIKREEKEEERVND